MTAAVRDAAAPPAPVVPSPVVPSPVVTARGTELAASGASAVSGSLAGLLAQWFTVINSPIAPGTPVAWTFDVVNINAGWMRIRVLSGGFVECSGINAIGTTTALNVLGRPF